MNEDDRAKLVEIHKGLGVILEQNHKAMLAHFELNRKAEDMHKALTSALIDRLYSDISPPE